MFETFSDGMDRTSAIIAGIGIGLPVGFFLYLLWLGTGTMLGPLYGGLLVLAAGSLIWFGSAKDKQ